MFTGANRKECICLAGFEPRQIFALPPPERHPILQASGTLPHPSRVADTILVSPAERAAFVGIYRGSPSPRSALMDGLVLPGGPPRESVGPSKLRDGRVRTRSGPKLGDLQTVPRRSRLPSDGPPAG